MRQLLIALLAIAALTACSEPVTNPEPEPEQAVTADVESVPTTPAPEPEQPAPPTAPGTEISQRGNAIKEIGETAFAYETDPADATFGCLPESELLPIDGIGPGENVTGKLILDTANPTGVDRKSVV